MSSKTLVEEGTEIQSPVTYFSSGLPQMRILIDNTIPNVPPRYAPFNDGVYITADPDEIKVLDKCSSVYRYDGRTYDCPICGAFSTPSARVFNQHMNHAHPSS